MAENINCGNFIFYNNFDSANLARVELVTDPETSNADDHEVDGRSCKSSSTQEAEYEFNLWTKQDCYGTPYQNNNKTWFHFGIKAAVPGVSVKLNIVNLNKQVKMFSQGMCPVFKTVPGHTNWERIQHKPSFSTEQKNGDFTLSFVYCTPTNIKAIAYFAFTYPFSYTDLQSFLRKLECRMEKRNKLVPDDIYYHRECAIKTLEGRRLDLLTISSYHNISAEREDRLKNLFPEAKEERPFKFHDKKIIFISARVHPGETPATFVFNGFLKFLLHREDQIASQLRRQYVFKLIPMLNPDGVAKGHYRMDTRGVNLNRVYLNPSLIDHPTIFAARTLIRYYHHSYNLPDEIQSCDMNSKFETEDSIKSAPNILDQQVNHMKLDEKNEIDKKQLHPDKEKNIETDVTYSTNDKQTLIDLGIESSSRMKEESRLFLYLDFHGHASKKGVFIYGNHFDSADDAVECMLFPKLMSINNPNFHFTSCNFSEKNMYLIDKRDGMSREGSGRVAVYKITGLIRSYTLECNYNSGRMVNPVPPRIRDGVIKSSNQTRTPPKYTPGVYEAVGAAIGPSILDLTNSNPNSRLPNSQFRSLRGVRSYLKMTCSNNVSGSPQKSHQKDHTTTFNSSDNRYLKEVESKFTFEKMNKESLKNESQLPKRNSIVRRASSLFSVTKRNKNNKKSRSTVNHNRAKIQYVPMSEEESTVQKQKSEIKSKFCCQCAKSAESDYSLHHTKCSKAPLKKYTFEQSRPSNRVSNNEDTSIVKQGAKRLKISSAKNLDQQQTVITDTSIASTSTKTIKQPIVKNILLTSKPLVKNSNAKIKRPHTADQTKIKKSKSKEKLKSNMTSRKFEVVNKIRK